LLTTAPFSVLLPGGGVKESFQSSILDLILKKKSSWRSSRLPLGLEQSWIRLRADKKCNGSFTTTILEHEKASYSFWSTIRLKDKRLNDKTHPTWIYDIKISYLNYVLNDITINGICSAFFYWKKNTQKSELTELMSSNTGQGPPSALADLRVVLNTLKAGK
jgi:hypothetical protein